MRLIAILIVLLFLPLAARADDDAVFHCAPKEFTLTPTDNGVNLSGDIHTPGKGYRYAFEKDAIDSTPESVHGTLTLTAPLASGGSGLAKLHIDEDIDVDVDVISLDVDFDKTYDFGPAKITCRKVVQPHD